LEKTPKAYILADEKFHGEFDFNEELIKYILGTFNRIINVAKILI
jgi:hypothetical protein